MSSNRFHLKGEFEVYGKKFKLDQSLNWSADSGQCDERISQWFATCYEEAYSEFQAFNYIADTERSKIVEEAKEREQLILLRKKYPDA
jgi:adenine C2-methylase RlmN of 23S rRNA A2503 and tRNA A37